jgi:HEAT repeat protein
VRASAVFALSQQKNAAARTDLIELARSPGRPAVRAAALFWLGQTGDPRAIEVFATILQLR